MTWLRRTLMGIESVAAILLVLLATIAIAQFAADLWAGARHARVDDALVSSLLNGLLLRSW
jgi:hypothetical protein